jgi:hypothetical protein
MRKTFEISSYLGIAVVGVATIASDLVGWYVTCSILAMLLGGQVIVRSKIENPAPRPPAEA